MTSVHFTIDIHAIHVVQMSPDKLSMEKYTKLIEKTLKKSKTHGKRR